MANNPQFAGVPGQPLRPPMIGSVGPPPNIPSPMPAQFWPLAPVLPPVPPTSQQFQPLRPGVSPVPVGIPPPPSMQTQFVQPIQQSPMRPLPPMSQPMPLSNVQSSRPTSGVPQPLQNLQGPTSYVPGSGAPGIPFPSSYAFTQSSYGQAPPHMNPAPQYQPVSQTNSPSIPAGGRPILSSGSQSAASTMPIQPSGQQPSASVSASPATRSQPKHASQSSSDWLEHTSATGRRYYYNKKTKQSTWEKPLELMTPIERADAATDWKEYTSPDGRKYYYNKVTKQSKWVIPEELKLARETVEKASFIERESEATSNSDALGAASVSGAKESSNTDAVPPAPVIESIEVTPGAAASTSSDLKSPGSSSISARDSATDANKLDSRPPHHSPSESAAISGSPSGAVVSRSGDITASPAETARKDSDTVSTKEAVDSKHHVTDEDVVEADKSSDNAEKTNAAASEGKTIEQEPGIYSSKMEAKEAFKALLESAKVESDWTWEQAMRVIINDKRYGALRTLGERKQAFNEYLGQKKKHDAEERRAKQRKAREDFRRMLEECTELTSTTRWSKAVSMFGDDERFKAIERARDREDLFQDYLDELEKKEKVKEAEERKRNKMEYRKFLESCDFIKASSQWRKVKDRLEADERCSRLESFERLEIFQEYIHDLEKEEEELRKMQKEEARKTERRNRDEFRKLMEGHVADGILTAKTHWREYHSKVKDLPAYLAVSSNTSGSTPKELFEDVSEELQKQYEDERTRIKDAVKLGKVSMSSTWTLEDFKASVAKNISSPPVSEANLKLVFDELLEKVREKEEKEAKKRKRLSKDFFSLLCSIKDITSDSAWEESRHLFKDSDEYSAIGDEAFLKQIYEEYIAQLKEKEKEKERKRKEEKARRDKERDKEKRYKERREKERRRERERRREKSAKDEVDIETLDVNETSLSDENMNAGKDRDKKHRKRHHDSEDDASIERSGKDHSRSSHRHGSDRKKSRQMDQYVDAHESDDERHKRNRRDHHNGARRTEPEELEDGEVGDW